MGKLKQILFQTKFFNIKRSQSRLRLILLLLVLTLFFPIAFLVRQTYRQLEKEAYFIQRSNAETLFMQIDQRASEILRVEDERPVEDYLFVHFTGDKSIVYPQFSPLSFLPANTPTPGLVGYFQIAPSGEVSTPLLPQQMTDIRFFGLNKKDLERRLAILSKMKTTLIQNRLLTQNSLASAGSMSETQNQDNLKETSSDNIKFNETKNLQSELVMINDQGLTNLFDDTTFKNYSIEHYRGNQVSPPPIGKKISELQFDYESFEESARESMIHANEADNSSHARPNNNKRVPLKVTESNSISKLFQINSLTATKPLMTQGGLAFLNTNKKNETVFKSKIAPSSSVLSFQGTVDPLQFAVLPTGDGVFFRRVWQNDKPMVQGFLVDMNLFLKGLFEKNYAKTPFSKNINMLLAYRGTILNRYERENLSLATPRAPAVNQVSRTGPQSQLVSETPLLRSPMTFPLNQFEILLTIKNLPSTPGRTVVNILAILVFLILGLGLFLIYKLALSQLEFAKQRSDFVSAISHELKTPLTSIRMYGEMLRDGWVFDEAKKKSYYDFIYFESERLSRLINNVLYLARYTNEDTRQKLNNINPNQLLETMLAKVQPAVAAAQFEIEVLVSPNDKLKASSLLIAADEDAMAQIFLNLIDNAIKFSKKGGASKVQIGFHVMGNPGDKLVFFVRDFGPGVPKDQREKIFQLFYRSGDEMTRTTSGTGIGLALVRQLADSMNAQVKLRNVNPGAEFRIDFRPKIADNASLL